VSIFAELVPTIMQLGARMFGSNLDFILSFFWGDDGYECWASVYSCSAADYSRILGSLLVFGCYIAWFIVML